MSLRPSNFMHANILVKADYAGADDDACWYMVNVCGPAASI